MQHLADLLATLPLQPPEGVELGDPRRWIEGCSACDNDLVHELGADLPAGHVHVWGGPSGAGKTAFLLCLLQGAAARGRHVVYATYDLPPETLALRLLAMTAGVPWRSLPDPGARPEDVALEGADLLRACAARDLLCALPFHILPARGFGSRSLADRLVRLPFRPEVLAVDYLQGVVREPGSEVGTVLRDLTGLAERLHLAVLCAVRAGADADSHLDSEIEALREGSRPGPDRLGWIASLQDGLRHAEVLHNRHGERAAVPLAFDEDTQRMERAASAATQAPPRP